MTDNERLSLYNGALGVLKETPLASLTEERESRRQLDRAWDEGAIRGCLEAGLWKFATRTVQADASPSMTPDFGYQFVFNHPDDFVKTAGVWADSLMTKPHRQYRDEAGYWYGSLETMFISYVSDDDSYGLDFSQWPHNFKRYVYAYLAAEIAGPLTERGDDMEKKRDDRLKEAKSSDAMADPTKFTDAGCWSQSRGRSGSRRDGQPR